MAQLRNKFSSLDEDGDDVDEINDKFKAVDKWSESHNLLDQNRIDNNLSNFTVILENFDEDLVENSQ
ncbi:unnamed protein product, partial [Brachionus calyciflorus]